MPRKHRVSKGNINYDYILKGNNTIFLKPLNPKEGYSQSIPMINLNNEMNAMKELG
ncbi:hypothetical protein [Tissierella praeacuta]|uniref:Uncharacterized protein n=1 Tax=Tissierella praeacuta DSM 18095 TaxID=1123404 RepID=A0A1M4VIT9_9FIRM|nr:hypothetical protein [Tissierella praeacuta]MBU5255427.1 hypothetical protein [Tissierella praeacuta]TCU79265.1 hypothetical protein EV204_101243 [Tissierella praeacuta]SHE68899.1 hypothetical protein SAMN02745784_01480 [Tissierella praeacuta DSM 18095]SUO99118.1 Uncharacterised protein [Tissierella praeacuta]